MKTKCNYDRTFYKGFEYHIEEAIKESGKEIHRTSDPRVAIFSRKYFESIQSINSEKKYDYCFIGNISSNYDFGVHRLWVINFAKQNFTSNSIFVNTENKPWESLGVFDYTNDSNFVRFCPRDHRNNQSKEAQYRVISENMDYFRTMRQSKFTLCPRGDAPWSYRFYECLMCGTIPVVEKEEHTFRTKEEGCIDYRYLMFNDLPHVYDENMIRHNYEVFNKHHLIN